MSRKKKKVLPIPMLDKAVTAIDTHCHLDMSAYKLDYEAVILRAFRHGVRKIITIGIDLESSKRAIYLSEKYDEVFSSVGVHPHNVEKVNDEDYEELIKLTSHPKVVAYGEIGMDSVKKYSAESLQKEHFTRQIKLAKELDLPVIVHDREAHSDVMSILEKEGPFPAGGVMHCFSGDVSLMRKVVELGFHISIPGVVTFNKSEIMQDVAREVPLDFLVLETDGPFLTPVPYRGKRNEPVYLLYTARKIAEIRGMPLEKLVKSTTQNAEKLFSI